MNCAEAREAMLVADVEDLRGRSSPLAVHFDDCARCRALAAAFANDTARLGAVLAKRRRPRVSRMAIVAAIPVAAAVLVAISINARRRPDVQAPSPSPSPLRSLPVERHVSLTVAPGQRATLIKTTDPNVTVIWLTPGGGQ